MWSVSNCSGPTSPSCCQHRKLESPSPTGISRRRGCYDQPSGVHRVIRSNQPVDAGRWCCCARPATCVVSLRDGRHQLADSSASRRTGCRMVLSLMATGSTRLVLGANHARTSTGCPVFVPRRSRLLGARVAAPSLLAVAISATTYRALADGIDTRRWLQQFEASWALPDRRRRHSVLPAGETEFPAIAAASRPGVLRADRPIRAAVRAASCKDVDAPAWRRRVTNLQRQGCWLLTAIKKGRSCGPLWSASILPRQKIMVDGH